MSKIGRMKTVGQTLKEAREAQFYTVEDVEKHLRIRMELLEALESDNYSKLPPATFIQGFIKNYSKFLGLDSEKMLALFRRDFEAKKHPPRVLESFKSPAEKWGFRITPSRVIGVVVSLLILSFFAYLWVEYHQFVGAPNLTVVTPSDQQSVDTPQVTVEGNTDPEVRVAVNNQDIGVDGQGHFREEIKLSGSTNTITITATSKFGKTAKVERTVFLRK